MSVELTVSLLQRDNQPIPYHHRCRHHAIAKFFGDSVPSVCVCMYKCCCDIVIIYTYNCPMKIIIESYTIYGKTFEWENFHGWYANDHSQENFCVCLMPSLSRALRETYKITYSTKICWKIFAIECKIMKTTKVFPLESFAVYGRCRFIFGGRQILTWIAKF